MQNSKDLKYLKSQLTAQNYTTLITFIYHKNPKVFIEKNLKRINIFLNKEEMDFLVDKISNIVAPYKGSMQNLNISDINQLLNQTDIILAELSELKAAPAPQPADYKSYITSQKEASNSTEHDL